MSRVTQIQFPILGPWPPPQGPPPPPRLRQRHSGSSRRFSWERVVPKLMSVRQCLSTLSLDSSSQSPHGHECTHFSRAFCPRLLPGQGSQVLLAWKRVGQAQAGSSPSTGSSRGQKCVNFSPFALLCFHFSLWSKLIMRLSASAFLVLPLWSEKWKMSSGNLRGHWFPVKRPRTGPAQFSPVCRMEKLLRDLGKSGSGSYLFLGSVCQPISITLIRNVCPQRTLLLTVGFIQ